MNLFTCKAQIISNPKLFLYKQKALTHMLICLSNYKKGSSWYCINTKSKGKMAYQIFDMCMKGKFFIIQGNIEIKYKKTNMHNKKARKRKFLMMTIKRIYPLKMNY